MSTDDDEDGGAAEELLQEVRSGRHGDESDGAERHRRPHSRRQRMRPYGYPRRHGTGFGVDDEEALCDMLDNPQSALDEDAKEVECKRERSRGGRRRRSPSPSRPAKIPVKFPIDAYDYKQKRSEWMTQNGGKEPYCFFCEWMPGTDDAQNSALEQMRQTYITQCGQCERFRLASHIRAHYEKKFLPLVIAHEKEQLAHAREDAKRRKDNLEQPWTTEDEKLYTWNPDRESEYKWQEFEIVYHMETFGGEELVNRRTALYAALAMQTIAEGGLLVRDPITGQLSVSKEDSVKFSLAYRVHREAADRLKKSKASASRAAPSGSS